MLKERPILFSAPMVRALLAGTKTQTRRVCKPQPIADARFVGGHYLPATKRNPGQEISVEAPYVHIACPYGQRGDRLWVRETWRRDIDKIDGARLVQYRADDAIVEAPRTYFDLPSAGWIPSIHMPRWASRITLEVTGVRVELLQEISEADAISEGTPFPCGGWVGGYQKLWESIHGPGSWEANPWVWVVEFKRVEFSPC
jgi:hypothetical protein